jgi:hypothetical protein
MGLKIPDWIIYGAALTLMVSVASSWHEDSPSPAAPPQPGVGEMALFANFTPFSTGSIINLPLENAKIMTGSAFSLSRKGEWVMARQSVRQCKHVFLNIGGNLAVPVQIKAIKGIDNYVLGITDGGAHPLTLADPKSIKVGQRGFMPGYPSGEVGEATARLIGQTTFEGSKRFEMPETVMAWAKAGQTRGVKGDLNMLAGGPTLDDNARLIGITLMEKPRRGRIYSSTPLTLNKIAQQTAYQPDMSVHMNITKRNYGIMSDSFRREYQVAQVGCIQS